MYRLEFRSYQRLFNPPLQTRHGLWSVRQGIILRLSDQKGSVSFGEIAPLSWFGSESFEQALDFCRQLPAEITAAMIFSIPSGLPACQFGFESAWEALTNFGLINDLSSKTLLTYCGLLPTGKAALSTWEDLWNQGYRTFKWKIGVAPIQTEIKIFADLVRLLPPGAKLRLDANGGLTCQSAHEWLRACDQTGIEFLEQPLSLEQLDAMLELSDKYATSLALDESVATLDQLQTCYQQGWRDVFVIKPAIAGSPSRLRQFCREHEIDAVFSSIFETAIGQQVALKLAREFSGPGRAVGFGVNHWFAEADQLNRFTASNFESLWNHL